MEANLQETCRFTVGVALRMGADEAEAWASSSRETDIHIENNDIKLGKSHRRGGVGIRIFKKKGLGFASVNSLSASQVEEAACRALSIANSSPSDPYNQLPDPCKVKRLRGIYDPDAEGFTAGDALTRSLEMLRAARAYDPRVTVDSGSFSGTVEAYAVVSSRGVDLSEKASYFSWTIMGMAIDGAEVSSFDVQVGGTHLARRVDTSKTGEDLARNVVSSLGARKTASFVGSLLLSPYAVQELLLGPIIHGASSNNVQKGLSRLGEKLGQPVASPLLTVSDDGTYSDGLAAGSFDREGVPHMPTVIIEEGILRSYLYNTYTALKEGRSSTGHAVGDSRASPSVGPSNIIIHEGGKSMDELLGEIKRGIFVTRYSGNVNPISGDFSGVVKGGRLIEGGEVKAAVRETLIGGNIYDLLRNVSGVSRERKMIISQLLPYIRVEEVSVTGG